MTYVERITHNTKSQIKFKTESIQSPLNNYVVSYTHVSLT